MFYLTSKIHDNRINAFGFMEAPPGPRIPIKPRPNRVKVRRQLPISRAVSELTMIMMMFFSSHKTLHVVLIFVLLHVNQVIKKNLIYTCTLNTTDKSYTCTVGGLICLKHLNKCIIDLKPGAH